jgi:hypothetical protein
MSVSRKKPAKKYQYVPVTNRIEHPLFIDGLGGVRNIIFEYAFSADPTWLKSAFTLFNSPSLEWKILTSAYYAAPLKDIETLVRTSHAREEKHLPLTLIKATKQAIQDGDVTLRDDKNVIICEGMANKLMMLYNELYPNQYHKCLTEAKRAAPLEDEEKKATRESQNRLKIKQIFDAVKQNDDKTTEAIKTFKDWANSTSVLNRIHLIYVAQQELAARGNELPSVNAKDKGNWNGILGHQFCFKVIGDGIQRSLPPFMQIILRFGLENLFYTPFVIDPVDLGFDDYDPPLYSACPANLVRQADPDASSFIYPPNTNGELGVSAYYSSYDGICLDQSSWWEAINGSTYMRLITSYHESIQQLLYSDMSLTPKTRIR